jgi:hypothetical protein
MTTTVPLTPEAVGLVTLLEAELRKLSGGVDRDKMPQVPEDQYPEFLKWLQDHGVVVRTVKLHPSRLKPMQTAFDADKVRAMQKNPKALAKPLLVAKDGTVVDGHHRAIAHHANKTDAPAHVIHLPKEKVFQAAHAFLRRAS